MLPPWPTARRPRVADLALTLTALLVFVALYTAARVGVTGPVRHVNGLVTYRVASPARPLFVAAVLSLAVVVIGRRRTRWRITGAIGLAISGTLALLLQPADPNFPLGDGALIEFGTLAATRGAQILGAYSQFGWRHPGPLLFYWLAPFYYLSGYTTAGMSVGVLLSGLLSVCLCARVVTLDPNRNWLFPSTFFLLLFAYLTRLPGLLSSAWNPHAPILPLLAFIVVSAAAMTLRIGLVPVVFVLGSFIVQAHVGFALVTAAVGALLAVVHAVRAWRQPADRRAIGRSWMLAVRIALVLWFLPLADEAIHHPGNLTLIWRFFTSNDPGQPIGFALRAWSTTLGALFRPDLSLPGGGGFADATTMWPRAIGIVALVGLIPVASRAWRQQRRFTAALATTSALASVAALASVIRVTTLLGDYHIFWLSIIGVLNVSLVVSELLTMVAPAVNASRQRTLTAAVCGVGVASIGIIGAVPQIRLKPQAPDGRTQNLIALYRQTLANLPSSGSSHPVMSLGDGLWGEGAGFVLLAERDGFRIAAAPEMLWMFNERQAANGSEDVLLTIAYEGEHDRLKQRPGNMTLASSAEFFIDGVSLVDHPELRPRR